MTDLLTQCKKNIDSTGGYVRRCRNPPQLNGFCTEHQPDRIGRLIKQRWEKKRNGK